jgi:protein-disulfide isomerase
MSSPDDGDLFTVKKWHIYVLVASVVSFIAGMTVRSLLLPPMPYYPTVASPIPTTNPLAGAAPTLAPAQSPALPGPSPTRVLVEVSSDDPALGPEDAPIVIVEFADFQCSYCARFAQETQGQILDVYGDQVRFVFRNFPLVSIHPQAQKAAEAARCAHDQGKFWEYHDLLFENQQELDAGSLKDYAGRLDLDVVAFDNCLDTNAHSTSVQHELTEGQSYGITGTPSFLINGRLLVGAKPFANFQAIIEDELGH